VTTGDKSKARRIIWTVLIAGVLCAGIVLTYLIMRRAPGYHRAYNKGVLELRSRNTEKALEYFRRAMEKKPGFLDARISLIRTLIASKEFDEATREIRSALEAGLPESEATYHRAQIGKARAIHRIATAGNDAAAELYNSIIEDDIEPAIEELLAHADDVERPARAYTLLGELFQYQGTVLAMKQTSLFAERETAVSLEHARTVAAKDFAITRIMSDLRTARLHSLNAFNRAIELDPQFAPPRLAAANYAILRYVPQPALAQDLLAPLLKLDPPNPDAVRMLTTIERMDGHHESALKHIRALRAKHPQDLMLFVDEIEVLFDLDRWEETIPLVQELTLLHPADPRVHYVRGRLLAHQGNYDEAARILERIFLQEALPWPQARFLLANALLENGRTDQAIAAYGETIKDIDAKRVANVKMAEEFRSIRYDCHLKLGRQIAEENPRAAAEHAKQAFDLFRERADAYQNVLEAYIAAGRIDQVPGLAVMHILAVESTQGSKTAMEMCRTEMKALDNNPHLRKLESALLVRMGSFTEAIAAIERLRKDFPDESAYPRGLARLHIQLGHVEDARKMYEEILERDPYDSSAISALLALLTGSGQMEDVRDLLKRAEDKLGPQKLRTLQMNLALAEKRPEEAIKLAAEHVNANPFGASAHELLAVLLWQNGEAGKARASFNTALVLDPAYRMAYRRGLLDMEEGRFQDAIHLFRQAIERMPDFPAVRVHLAVALSANGQIDTAIKTLEEVQETILYPSAQDDALQWFLALIYAAQGNTERAHAYNYRVTSMPFVSVDDRQSLLVRMACMEAPDRHAASTALALSSIFARNGCLNSAQSQLRRAQELLPNNPMVACWLSQILLKQNEYAESAKLLEKTIAENPSFITARIMLAESYVQGDDLGQAAEVLAAALNVAAKPRLPWIRLRLAKIQDAMGMYDAAIKNYMLAMKAPQTEVSACSEVAWLLATVKGAPEQAIPYARRSLELKPDNPAVLDTLGWALFLCGDIDSAVEHLERAKRSLPSNPTIRFHLAQAYLKAGRSAEAKTELTESLAISDTFPEASEARRLLGPH